ncbi:MAG TPA: FAD-dependent oxidoreductase [Candidatus Dormibacteraeota bacterium]|nr:FAD-dependent oxidoreductase [Candidatus Dormibacteraeota bacterium]
MTAGREGRSPDVVIVGGGIVGASAAAFLAADGARVVLVERDGLAAGASGANSGVVQHPFDPVLADLYRETLELYRDLSARDLGFRLARRPAGMLFVTEDEGAAAREAALIGDAFPELRLDVLGGDDLLAAEPGLARDLWACRAEIGFPVAPGASTYAYATLAESLGAEIRQGRGATLELDGDVAAGVRVDGRLIDAAAVLVAAGPWTSGLLDPRERWRPIVARWGIVVEAELADPPRHVLEEAGIDAAIALVPETGRTAAAGEAVADGPEAEEESAEFSLVPLPGASAVGSTFLAREPDPRAWIERILLGAQRFVPTVADAPIRGVRSCARPQSLDGRPLVGAVPGIERAYVCAGHGAWGISTGPESARLVAELILGRAPEIPAELDPRRFGSPLG